MRTELLKRRTVWQPGHSLWVGGGGRPAGAPLPSAVPFSAPGPAPPPPFSLSSRERTLNLSRYQVWMSSVGPPGSKYA